MALSDNEIALALIQIAKANTTNISLANGKLTISDRTNTASFEINRPRVVSQQTAFFR